VSSIGNFGTAEFVVDVLDITEVGALATGEVDFAVNVDFT